MRFWKEAVQHAGHGLDGPQMRGTAPLPCPIPFDLSSPRPPSSPRRRRRWHVLRQRRWWINFAVALLSWQAMGRPRDAHLGRRLCCRMRPEQRTLVQQLERTYSALCRPGETVVAPGGGLQSLAEAVDAMTPHCYGWDTSALDPGPAVLSPNKLSIPSKGALVELRPPLIPRTLWRLLSRPGAFALPASRVPVSPAGSFLSCTSVDGVMARLWDARLLAPLPADVLRLHGGAPVRAGLFGVAKKDSDKLRVIIDRRRQNALEKPFVEALREQGRRDGASEADSLLLERLATFPHGSQFCDFF